VVSEKRDDPTRVAKCKRCEAEVRWATWRKSGKRMPVDAEPVADGDLWLSIALMDGAQVMCVDKAGAAPGRNRYVSHFKTCPFADQERRS
jgi:hypothetical protein